VLIRWLALLLVRLAEVETDMSWALNPAALNPTADNMLQRSGGINAGSARHAGILPKPIQKIKH